MSSVLLFILFGGMMFLMHRGGGGGCCGGHQHNENHEHNSHSHGEQAPAVENDKNVDMVQDPVCGMWVQSSDAIKRDGGDGAAVYFCSEACASEYRSRATDKAAS